MCKRRLVPKWVNYDAGGASSDATRLDAGNARQQVIQLLSDEICLKMLFYHIVTCFTRNSRTQQHARVRSKPRHYNRHSPCRCRGPNRHVTFAATLAATCMPFLKLAATCIRQYLPPLTCNWLRSFASGSPPSSSAGVPNARARYPLFRPHQTRFPNLLMKLAPRSLRSTAAHGASRHAQAAT